MCSHETSPVADARSVRLLQAPLTSKHPWLDDPLPSLLTSTTKWPHCWRLLRSEPIQSMQYPAHVLAALETAYCAHFRAFMEFVHNGRPKSSGQKTDTKLDDFTDAPVHVEWKQPEQARFRAADKLGAHVSRGRAERRHIKRPWGGAEDHALVLPLIRDVFRLVPGSKHEVRSVLLVFYLQAPK